MNTTRTSNGNTTHYTSHIRRQDDVVSSVHPYSATAEKFWRVVMGLALITLPVIFYAIITNL